MSIGTTVEAVSDKEKSGIATFANSAMKSLQEHEDYIADSFQDGLNRNGNIMKVPPYLMERFKMWEEHFTTPEDLAMVAAAKKKTLEALRETSDYVAEQAEKKVDRVRLEIAVKAVSRMTQAAQQVLSSQ